MNLEKDNMIGLVHFLEIWQMGWAEVLPLLYY